VSCQPVIDETTGDVLRQRCCSKPQFAGTAPGQTGSYVLQLRQTCPAERLGPPTPVAVRAAAVRRPGRALVALRVRSLGTERGEVGREAGRNGGALPQVVGGHVWANVDWVGQGRGDERDQSVKEMHFSGE
jgi:hypothetical protein